MADQTRKKPDARLLAEELSEREWRADFSGIKRDDWDRQRALFKKIISPRDGKNSDPDKGR